MAQPFDCLCGKPTCRGRISGAKNMTRAQLEGAWLNGHKRQLLQEQQNAGSNGTAADAEKKRPENGASRIPLPETNDPTAQALKDALLHAEKVVEAARVALISYVESVDARNRNGKAQGSYNGASFGAGPGDESVGLVSGASRRGPTSRELSGEMGGDTICA